MKVLSLWQPWASAIALGAKRIETRDWYTSYRGPLAIHAAKRCIKGELLEYASCWEWRGALGLIEGHHRYLWESLPFGAIVAVCNLIDCAPTDAITVAQLDTRRRPTHQLPGTIYEWTERQMGNFAPGRFGWILDDIRPLPAPVAARGYQGLFDFPDAILAEAAA